MSEQQSSEAGIGLVLLPIFVVVAIDTIGTGIILPLLPFYATHLGATPFAIGALLAMFAACQLISGPALGSLSDRYGRKPVLVVSQLGTLASFVLMATARSLWILFLARAIDGITSGNISAAFSYATDRSTAATRRQAISITSAAVGFGLLAGPGLSSLFARSPSEPIWAAACFSALSVLATALLIPREAVRTSMPKSGESASALFRDRKILAILSLLGLFYMAMSIYIAGLALVLHAQATWHGVAFGQQQLGFVFMASGIVSLLVQLLLIKPVGKRVKDWQLAVVCFLFVSAGYMLSGYTSLAGPVALAVMLSTFGSSFIRPTLITTLTLAVPGPRQGLVSGVNSSLFAATLIVGPLVAGELINRGAYHGWAMTASSLAAIGAAMTLVLVGRNAWPRYSPAPSRQNLKPTLVTAEVVTMNPELPESGS